MCIINSFLGFASREVLGTARNNNTYLRYFSRISHAYQLYLYDYKEKSCEVDLQIANSMLVEKQSGLWSCSDVEERGRVPM